MLSFFFIVDNLNVSFINNKRSQLIRLFYVVSKKVEEFFTQQMLSQELFLSVFIYVLTSSNFATN
jgi:hypothetical protein